MFYRVISFILSLIVLAVSIFYFIEDMDEEAFLFLYLTVYTFLTSFYLFKSLYYRAESATFNELFFVAGLPTVPIILSITANILEINSFFDRSTLIITTINIGEVRELYVHTTGILVLPFYIFSLYLLLRTFIRYKFIRWTAYSEGGIPAVLFGIILSLGIGFVYFMISMIMGDLLLLLFGFMYALTGILGFFA